MKNLKRKDEEGAMGVGTLIVFIAMVLVAAVAASVLIDTANKLQQQAQKTGDQAVREVSTSFMVKEVYGLDNDPDGTEQTANELSTIKLKIGLSAGSPAQNLDQTLIEIDDGTNSASLEYASGGSDGTHYGASAVLDLGTSFSGTNPIVEQGDTIVITIDAYDALNSNDIGTQTQVNIKIVPKHGTSTLETFVTPPVINDEVTHLA